MASRRQSAVALGRNFSDVDGLAHPGLPDRRPELRIYPLARGVAPFLLMGLAFFSIGETIALHQFLGVISISIGIATLAFLGTADGQVLFMDEGTPTWARSPI